MQIQKKQLREAMRQKLAAMDPTWRLEASRSLVAQVTKLEIWRNAKVIGLFAGRIDEIETSLFWKTGKTFLYPRIENEDLHFLPVNSLADLKKGNFNLHEPLPGESAIPELIVVPGLAFDRNGGRLGRGQGFYDRWLTKHPEVKTIGVCFDFQLVPEVPMGPEDQWLDYVMEAAATACEQVDRSLKSFP